MTRTELLQSLATAEHSPGFRAYAFHAAIWCADCIRTMAENGELDATLAKLTGEPEYMYLDTETLPQPAFFPESNCAEHCDGCGEYLYGEDSEEA
jgi:hypothetical protein